VRAAPKIAKIAVARLIISLLQRRDSLTVFCKWLPGCYLRTPCSTLPPPIAGSEQRLHDADHASELAPLEAPNRSAAGVSRDA
jgi:hypothetical protein